MKIFIMGILLLFGTIGVIGWIKNRPKTVEEVVQEIPLGTSYEPLPVTQEPVREFPEVDRIAQLFAFDASKLPIVETISFTSRVPWLQGRAAWVVDYATHYQTSRHFIARSLNGTTDYFSQTISPGDKFNVFKKDRDIRFHLLIDLSQCRLWLSYTDGSSKEPTLLKTYHVGVGRTDAESPSGCLTPIGTFRLGEKIAIYKPGTISNFKGERKEMIRVFGTRWIPFEKDAEIASGPSGLGIHGAPWIEDAQGNLVEDRSKIGKYDSDGCIRLASEDIDEIFAIVITKPTTVEIVESREQK